MPSTYSAILRLTKQADGENAGTWGQIVNEQFLQLIEDAVATTANITATGGAYTLTTGYGTTDQARCAVLNLSATLSSNLTITAPSVSKIYLILNNTVGSFSASIQTSNGNALSIPQGDKMFVYCDGTNFYKISDSAGGGGSTSLQGTATGAINMNNFAFTNAPIATSSFTGGTISGAAITNGTITSAQALSMILQSYSETVLANSNATGTLTLDYNSGNFQLFTLTGNATIATANWPTATAGSMTVKFVQDSTGGRALTLPSSFKAAGGTPIALSTAANAVDMMYINSPDGTTFYYNVLKAFA